MLFSEDGEKKANNVYSCGERQFRRIIIHYKQELRDRYEKISLGLWKSTRLYNLMGELKPFTINFVKKQCSGGWVSFSSAIALPNRGACWVQAGSEDDI